MTFVLEFFLLGWKDTSFFFWRYPPKKSNFEPIYQLFIGLFDSHFTELILALNTQFSYLSLLNARVLGAHLLYLACHAISSSSLSALLSPPFSSSFFFETMFYYVAQIGFEVIMWPRLDLNSQKFSCLSFLGGVMLLGRRQRTPGTSVFPSGNYTEDGVMDLITVPSRNWRFMNGFVRIYGLSLIQWYIVFFFNALPLVLLQGQINH